MKGISEQDKASGEGVSVVQEGREEERWEKGDIETGPETKDLAVALLLSMPCPRQAMDEQKVGEGYKKIDRAQHDY